MAAVLLAGAGVGVTTEASAAQVIIDPGLFAEHYWVGGTIRSGRATVDLPPGIHTISPGGYNGFEILVAADGSVSVPPASAAEATVEGRDTVRFVTVPVTVDPGPFVDTWRLHGFTESRFGARTIHLVPQGRYFMSVNVGGFYFDLDAAGRASIPASDANRATATGSTLSFVTVPVDVDPALYVDLWTPYGARTWAAGRRTVRLLADSLQYLNVAEYNGIHVRTDAAGAVSVPAGGSQGIAVGNERKAEASGSSLRFATHPVTVDTADYTDTWGIGYGAAWHFGDRIKHLVPGRYRLSASAYNSWWFSVSTGGAVSVEGALDKVDVSGATMTFRTTPVAIETGAYVGEWNLWGNTSWVRGPATRALVPGRYLMQLAGTNAVTFTVDAGGTVVLDPADEALGKAMGGGGVELLTQPIRITTTSGWSIHRVQGAGGPPVVDLVPGAYWFVGASHDFTIRVTSPCGVTPDHLVTPTGATFDLACEVERDLDGDGVIDDDDSCVDVPNEDQLDLDLDGAGDACDEDDDGDGVHDESDVCPDLFDPQQLDGDGDGAGDACDGDDDDDLVADELDNCVGLSNPDQADTDADAWGDACDDDDDEDGVADAGDVCSLVPDPDQADSDGDGGGDACDGDDDGDGVADGSDVCSGTSSSLAVTDEGCSSEQHVARACDPVTFRNHGQYVRCVTHAASDLVASGVIGDDEAARLVSRAARSR